MANNHASLDTAFHALADPTRRAVVQRLGHGSASVSDLARPFHMALPSFMKHLGILEASGLIASRKIGRVRTCALEPQRLAAVEKWFGEQRALWESRYQNLDKLLAAMDGEENES
jgi:DNA-binding transcriptional ArsR family regulator